MDTDEDLLHWAQRPHSYIYLLAIRRSSRISSSAFAGTANSHLESKIAEKGSPPTWALPALTVAGLAPTVLEKKGDMTHCRQRPGTGSDMPRLVRGTRMYLSPVSIVFLCHVDGTLQGQRPRVQTASLDRARKTRWRHRQPISRSPSQMTSAAAASPRFVRRVQ